MLQTIVQAFLKALSGMSCLAVILADASALSGIFLGYGIVQSTQLTDPIMSAIFGTTLLYATFIDIFNQAIGLIFALCLEMQWMLRLYMGLTLTILFIRLSTVCRPPVAGLKGAPFLGRPWSDSNTPYDQMDRDLVNFYSQPPSQARLSSLAAFEERLHCCGVNSPSDYSAKLGRPPSCRSGVAGGPAGPTGPVTNFSGRQAPGEVGSGSTTPAGGSTTPAGGGITLPSVTVPDTTPTGAEGDSAAGLSGCRHLVWALWEGSKVTFDATVSAITFAILTVLLTVAWCELWGEGLISGVQCCQRKPARKAP